MRLKAVVLVCLLAGVVGAGAEAVARPQIEATMVVTGTLHVDTTGAVTAHTLDRQEKLPAAVVQLLEEEVPTFRFKPVLVGGVPHEVDARMNLEVLANQIDPGHIALRVRSARFTDKEEKAGSPAAASIAKRPPMHYPDGVTGVSATVYLALRFDRSGKVTDVEVSQVNLRVDGTPIQMNRWRAMFARSAMANARKIELYPPTSGPHAGDGSLTGILPMTYLWDDQRLAGYGEWDSYVPGPRQVIPWMKEDGDADDNATVPDGEFAMTGSGLTLLTPLGGG